MGKTSKSAKASPRAPAVVSEEVLSKVASLKADGNKAFAKRDYSGALEQYEAAARLLPEAAPEKVDLLCNRAACYFQMRRYKDATKECSSALQLAPSNAKALQRRARSLEQQGLYKQALSDVQAVNKTDAATDESRESERRLRDILAGRRPASALAAPSSALTAPAANGAAAAAAAQARAAQAAAAQAAQARPGLFAVAAKCTLGGETRQVHMTNASSYAQLLDAVRAKFPDAGPFKIQYVDRDGDSITVTSRNDVRAAVAEMVAAAAQPKGGVPPIAPALKLALVPCGEAEVPAPPKDEVEAAEALRRQQEAAAARIAAARREQERAAAAEAAASAQAAPLVGAAPGGEVVEIDDWLIDFANLFREVSGLDADRHAELQSQGWDATTRAMEAALRSDAAAPLFDAAADRFRDVTCTGLLNWGNVSVCVAHKLLDDAAERGAELSTDVIGSAEAAFDKAEARYREALAFHPGFFDGLCALGQLESERAKLRARLLVKPAPPPAGGAGDEKAAADAAAAAQAEALRAGLSKVSKADVEAAAPHMAKAREWYAKAVAAAEAADERRKAEQDARAGRRKGQQQAAAAPGAPAAEASEESPAAGADSTTFAAQTRVMEGNALYEWSQLLAAAGCEWRAALDEAAGLFRAAACSEADVRGALKNHTRAAELDLGPDPEPEAPAAPAAAGAAAAACGDGGAGAGAAAKAARKPAGKPAGLPSLDRKK